MTALREAGIAASLDTTGIESGVRKATASLGALTTETVRLAKEKEKLEKAVNRAAAQFDPYEKAAQRVARVEELLSRAREKGAIDEARYGDVLNDVKQKLDVEAAELRRVREEYDRVATSVDANIARSQQLASAERAVQDAARRKVIDEAEQARMLALLRERYEQADPAVRKMVADQERARAEADRLEKEYRQLAASLDPNIAKTQRLAEVERILNGAVAAGLIDQREQVRLMALAQRQREVSAPSVLNLANSVRALASSYVVLRAIDIGRWAVETSGKLDAVRASLNRVTDSQEEANQLFSDFAATPGTDVDDLAKAYVHLVDAGLRPSTRELRVIAGIAAGTGKSVEEAAESIARASDGQVRRLRELGIQAKVIGDNVVISFRGSTETVKNNAADIFDAVQRIGTAEFGTALADKASTAAEAIDDVKDNLELLADALIKAGLGEAIHDVATELAALASDKSAIQFLRALGIAATASLGPLKEIAKIVGKPAAILGAAHAGAAGEDPKPPPKPPRDLAAERRANAERKKLEEEQAERDKRAREEAERQAVQQARHFEQLRTQLAATTAARRLLSEAYGQGAAAVERMTQKLEVEKRFQQESVQVAKSKHAELRRLIEDQVEADRAAAGDKTIAALTEQRDGLLRVAEAWQTDAEAATTAQAMNALAAQKLAATTGAAEDQRTALERLVEQIFELTRANEAAARVDGLTRENAQLAALADAYQRGAVAVARMSGEQQTQNAIVQATNGLYGEERRRVEDLVREHERLAAVTAARSKLAELQEQAALQQQVLSVYSGIFTSEEQYREAVEKVNQEHEVRVALLAVEEQRARALAAVAITDAKALAEVNQEFNRIADETEISIRTRRLAEFKAAVRTNVQEPLVDAWRTTESQALDTLATIAAGGKVSTEDLIDDWLRMWFRAMEEWLLRWIATQRAAQAASADTGAMSSGGGGGGWGSLLSGIFGGGGAAGAGALGNGAAGSSTAVAGGGPWGINSSWAGASGSGSGAAGGLMAGGAVSALGWAAIMVGVFAAFTHYMETHQARRADSNVGAAGGRFQAGAPTGKDHNHRQAQQAAEGVAAAMNAFLDQFQAYVIDSTIKGVVQIRKRGQGKNTDWVVYANGIAQHFGKDMQAAMEYAAVQGLKNAQIAGLSPEVKQAIAGTAAATMDALQEDLAHGLFALQARIGQYGSQLLAVDERYDAEIAAQLRLGIAIDATVAARQREEDALRNQLLGIDTSAAQRLRDLASWQDAVAERAARLREQLAAAQRDLEARQTSAAGGRNNVRDGGDAAGEVDEETRRLREAIERYRRELAEIPEALSDVEIDMGVFDTLYRYLEGNARYARQAHDYARLKVEAEFEALRLQLVAMGKWDQFAQMWSDAYAAAVAAAGGKGKGGGGGKGNDRQNLRDWLDDNGFRLLAAQMSPVRRALTEMNREYDEQLKLAHGDAAAIARLNEQRRIEGDLIRQQARRDVDADTDSFTGDTNAFTELDDQAQALRDRWQDLLDAGAASADETAAAIGRIDEAERRRIRGLTLEGYGNLLSGANAYLEDSTLAMELERMRFELVVLNYDKELELLRAKGDLTDAELAKLLEIQGRLHDFDFDAWWQRRQDGSNYTGPRFQGYANDNTPGGANSLLDEAARLLAGYRDRRLNPIERERRQIEEDFAKIFAAYGRGGEALDEYRRALDRLSDDAKQSVRELLEELNHADYAPTSGAERLQSAEEHARDLYRRAAGGDLDAFQDVAGAIQDWIAEAQSYAPSSPLFYSVFAEANRLLNELLGMRLFAGGGVSARPAIFGERGPEAAVPLPDGRTIPVTLNGSGLKSVVDAVDRAGLCTGRQLVRIEGAIAKLAGAVDELRDEQRKSRSELSRQAGASMSLARRAAKSKAA